MFRTFQTPCLALLSSHLAAPHQRRGVRLPRTIARPGPAEVREHTLLVVALLPRTLVWRLFLWVALLLLVRLWSWWPVVALPPRSKFRSKVVAPLPRRHAETRGYLTPTLWTWHP
ncbi:MAG: hypothetical protein GY772_19790 [bacterium]|nr:hypothetical protein [bacterium]